MSKLDQFVLISSMVSLGLFLSNSGGVPQAVSNAPGEANNKSCTNCHIPGGNFNPSIGLEVMNTDSTLTTTYIPGNNYIVRIKIQGENNPKAFGFQMVCLTADNNEDMGVWSGFGSKVKQRTMLLRKYLEQSGPKTNGIFTANWKAPNTDKGLINFYFAGLASNQNGNTDGDNNITGKLTLNSPTVSSISDNEFLSLISIYPNPVHSVLHISGENISIVKVISTSGSTSSYLIDDHKNIDVSGLANGLYIVVFYDGEGKVISTQRMIKL